MGEKNILSHDTVIFHLFYLDLFGIGKTHLLSLETFLPAGVCNKNLGIWLLFSHHANYMSVCEFSYGICAA